MLDLRCPTADDDLARRLVNAADDLVRARHALATGNEDGDEDADGEEEEDIDDVLDILADRGGAAAADPFTAEYRLCSVGSS